MGNSGEERAYITNGQKENSQVTEGYLWYSSVRLMPTKQELVGVFEFAGWLAKWIAFPVISILMVRLYLKSLSKNLFWTTLQNKAVSL